MCFFKQQWWVATFWGPKISMILTPCHPKKIAIWTNSNKPEPWNEVSSRNRSQMAWRFPHDHIQCISRKIPIPSIDGHRLQSVKYRIKIVNAYHWMFLTLNKKWNIALNKIIENFATQYVPWLWGIVKWQVFFTRVATWYRTNNDTV
jgi:hypothetical protein